MTCTSCGDKPKGSSKGFPKAVVEINNPESLVLLRKVVIPVSMGTEEDVPPAIGKYFNVLLQYESNGHIYLYSSDGIPTAIEANIPQEVLDRIDQLEIDVDLLETGLANETTAREAADSALSSSINSLSSSLSAETAAREQADTTLQNNIAAEATARANADTNLQNQIAQEAQARAAADTAINGAITAEASTRQTADAGLQSQIDAITASSDVKDIVGTKAELNNYDTSTLGNNDIIKVLQDESENDATTYYRWNATTQQFTLIGEEGPYYTKSQADTLLNAKQNTLTAGPNVQIVNDTISATDTTYTAGTGLALNGTQFSVDTTAIATQSDLTAGLANKQDTLTAGANIQINNNTISATDTTYSAFTGTDGQTAGAAGLVPAPATTDAGKFLKADGSWDVAGGGGGDTVYSSKTTSNSATGGAVYIGNLGTDQTEVADPTTTDKHYRYFWALPFDNAQIPQQMSINIFGQNEGMNSISLGVNAVARLDCQVAIGAQTLNNYSATEGVALGYSARSQAASSVALGARATATRAGEVNVGNRSGEGFNNTEYRVIGGVHDAVDAHDAVTKGQLDGRVITNAGAPTTATVGTVGQLLEDTTNGKLYQCTAVDVTDPQNPSYTWTEVGAGGGSSVTVVQTTGTSQTDVMSQNATTSMVFADPSTKQKVQIGRGAMTTGINSVAIGKSAQATKDIAVALGSNTAASGDNAIAIGQGSIARAKGSIAIGRSAEATTQGTVVFNMADKFGYNNTQYMLITGLYDPQNAHDAATKGYVDTQLDGKQDELTAGTGITITDESGALVISATGGSGASAFTTNEWNALWA